MTTHRVLAPVVVEARPRRFVLGVALALIADHHCPCCEAVTATCDYPSWRRCTECRCMWREDVIQSRRYACHVRGAGCRFPEEEINR